jgi:hypothetical protein
MFNIIDTKEVLKGPNKKIEKDIHEIFSIFVLWNNATGLYSEWNKGKEKTTLNKRDTRLFQKPSRNIEKTKWKDRLFISEDTEGSFQEENE